MNKTKILTTTLIFLVVLQMGLVLAEENYVRRLVTKNSELGVTEVKLGITYPGDVILIDEEFSSAECTVFSYDITPDIYMKLFEENTNAWILGNQTGGVNVILTYTIPHDCVVSGGTHYILDENEEIGDGSITNESFNGSLFGETENSGGESSVTLQVDNEEAFEESLSAAQRFFGLDVSQRFEVGSFTTIVILVIIALVIILFFAYSFLRKPKDFVEQAKASMPSRK
ncbi:hypothetical protein HOA55_04450 [archaeon]|jgi:hypothetical protein|nr:hypothetical protein [archaeon]MBT3577977.1 hypothetical protein [archaeon]MBT6820580.1 hypothetical protein [archaeon]MBT6956515.1 hypothetical protein [archaeon]MBT7025831.1 hypothetical protein [archaeon]